MATCTKYRSAITGRYISKASAMRWPKRTVAEKVKPCPKRKK